MPIFNQDELDQISQIVIVTQTAIKVITTRVSGQLENRKATVTVN